MEGLPSEPGLSIFQGSGQLQLDTGTQSELEEEAVADQQRRDEELQKLLTNAFDDLYDDNYDRSTESSIALSERNSQAVENEINQSHNIADSYCAALFSNSAQTPQYILENGDTSRRYHCPNDEVPTNTAKGIESYMNRVNLVDSLNHQYEMQGAGGDSTSVSALHYQHCFRTSPGGMGSGDIHDQDDNERYREAGFGSMDQLQVLYEVRVREVTRLTQKLESLTQEATREKDELRRQIAFREAEKERAQLLYQQTQTLLVDSKGKIADLEKQVSSLEGTVTSLDKAKSDLSKQLECSKASMEDLHQKILLLERGNLNNTEKHLDAFLRNVQNMHSQQLKKLEDELALAVSRLSAKEAELECQKQEALNRQQQLEARLAEKGDTVNQMARSLEEAQRQCQNLMTQGTAQEVAHLQLKLSATEKESQNLSENLQISQREMDALRVKLKQYETVLKEELLQDAPDGTDESLSTEMYGITSTQLRSELRRALLGQKLKLEEIDQLNNQLETYSQELSKLRSEKEQHKTQLEQLQVQQTAIQDENQKFRKSLKQAHHDLEEQKHINSELQQKLSAVHNSITMKVELEEKTQALLKAREQCQKLSDELTALKCKEAISNDKRDYSEEFLHFHERKLALALEECNRVHKQELAVVRSELEQARKEGDGLKELYINVCHSKDKLVSELNEEQNHIKELEKLIQHLQAEKQAIDHVSEAGTSRVQNHLQTIQKTQIQTLNAKIDDLQQQNKLLLEKLEKGKDNLEAAQKAVSETVKLQAELLTQTEKQKSLEEHYELELRKLQMEKEQAIQKLENEYKEFYAAKVTNEIEKAKTDALLELKKNWQENGNEGTFTKMKQLEEDHVALQQQLEATVQRHAEDTATLSRHLEQAKCREAKLERELALKEEQLHYLKPGSHCNDTADSSAIEKMRKEMMAAFAAKLQALQTQHQLQLDETCERVKDETVRFCVQQVRLVEANYLTSIKKYREAYTADVEKLHGALNDTENKLASTTKMLKETKSLLEREQTLKGHESEWKAKILAVEEQLKTMEVKAENAEKNLEVTKVKYQAAKKAVYTYKKLIDAQQKHMEKEWGRINAEYLHTLNQVQQKLLKCVCKEGINTETC